MLLLQRRRIFCKRSPKTSNNFASFCTVPKKNNTIGLQRRHSDRLFFCCFETCARKRPPNVFWSPPSVETPYNVTIALGDSEERTPLEPNSETILVRQENYDNYARKNSLLNDLQRALRETELKTTTTFMPEWIRCRWLTMLLDSEAKFSSSKFRISGTSWCWEKQAQQTIASRSNAWSWHNQYSRQIYGCPALKKR